MKSLSRSRVTLGLLVIILLATVAAFLWSAGNTKRSSLKTLSNLERVVNGDNQLVLQSMVILPETARNKSQAEADQWLRDVLRDEISKAGIRELKRSARFGSLTEIFPETATVWAEAAGRPPDECFAFRMERNGVTAEVVIVPDANGFRISRCNNVKQMAQHPES